MKNRRVTVSFTVMILMASILLLTGCGSQVKVNSETMETAWAKPEAFSVYGGEDIGFSFLYPKGLPLPTVKRMELPFSAKIREKPPIFWSIGQMKKE